MSNFLAVHRVRPRDDESDDGISDDIVSDEDLQVSSACLAEALRTRIGGREESNQAEASRVDGQSHHKNSEAAIERGEHIWGSSSGSSRSGPNRSVPAFVTAGSIEDILKEATASQRRETSMHSRGQEEERLASLQTSTSATANDVAKWLANLKTRKDSKGRLVTNAKQFEAVEKVAERVMQELRAGPDAPDEAFGEPLRWCVHGGPGTGKSKHVIAFIKELFQEVLHWDMGVEFQIVALQAVMADLLGGDTIHHALGIPVFRRGAADTTEVTKHMEVAKRVLQWRWLIIDEISMVSAKLLADVDLKLRQVIREVGTAKHGQRGRDRPFGGLNVIISGDF